MSRIRNPHSRRNRHHRERFIRMAESRVNRILKAMRHLGRCANRSNYDYGPRDVTAIFDALEDGMTQLRRVFVGESPIVFTLDKPDIVEHQQDVAAHEIAETVSEP
jgi:hypothetical protein